MIFLDGNCHVTFKMELGISPTILVPPLFFRLVNNSPIDFDLGSSRKFPAIPSTTVLILISACASFLIPVITRNIAHNTQEFGLVGSFSGLGLPSILSSDWGGYVEPSPYTGNNDLLNPGFRPPGSARKMKNAFVRLLWIGGWLQPSGIQRALIT